MGSHTSEQTNKMSILIYLALFANASLAFQIKSNRLASNFLTSHRVRRQNEPFHNDGTNEDYNEARSDLEQECYEEKDCTLEEIKEVYPGHVDDYKINPNDLSNPIALVSKNITRQCELEKYKCDVQGTDFCQNIYNDRICTCKPGFCGVDCTEYTDECTQTCKFNEDTDNYELYNNQPSHECNSEENFRCINLTPTNEDTRPYKCECVDGYQKIDDKCVDVDECSQNICGSANCENLAGSFSCSCDDGYIFDAENKSCEDIDECEMGDHECAGDEKCVNSLGAFECACADDGFEKVGGHCQDKDECYDETHNCGDNSVCNNQVGSFECICGTGFNKNYKGDCEDIDECEARNPCVPQSSNHKAECSNTHGSYICMQVERSACAANNPCGAEQTCQDSFEGSGSGGGGDMVAECTCDQAGYKADGTDCVDIDECTERPNSCGRSEQCHNTVGSFLCCPRGEEPVFGKCAKKCCPTAEVRIHDGTCVKKHACKKAGIMSNFCTDNTVCQPESRTIKKIDCICLYGYKLQHPEKESELQSQFTNSGITQLYCE